MDHIVAATRRSTTVEASIGVVLIAVITGFVAALTLGQIAPGNAITADGDGAAGRADVFVDLVAVVAGFVAGLEFT